MNRFDAVAKDWDNKPTSKLIAQKSALGIKAHVNLQNKDILDYGCGSGLLAFSVSQEAKSVLGMDNSTGMVEVFNQKAKEFGFDNIHAMKHNINEQNLASNQFDVIISSMTLHHILKPENFFTQCQKALKNGGYLCISDLDEEDGTFHAKHNNDGVEHFGFSHEQIKTLYKNSGFELIYLENICEITRENGVFPIFLAIGKIK
jgi:2-polyprenyl-3-methyl-5-hydroxy-6-metoxy-1,4-benzoquinol methylase